MGKQWKNADLDSLKTCDYRGVSDAHTDLHLKVLS